MKRTFLFLVLFVAGYYGYEAANIYRSSEKLVVKESGKISEVAEKVTPVLLDTGSNGPAIKEPLRLQKYGAFIYLISEEVLHCFHQDGRYMGQITHPDELLVADYLIDTYQQQLIVMGNEDDVWYYTMDGKLKHTMKFPEEEEGYRLRSIAYYYNRIWLVKEQPSFGDHEIKRVVAEYDTTFYPLNTYSLGVAKTSYGYESARERCVSPSLAVAKDKGEIYVYDPSRYPESLLEDTLLIRKNRMLSFLYDRTDITIYPLKIGSRFLLSASNKKESDSYLYCFDEKANKCWQLKNGFKDNIYSTGYIANLQSMDLTGETYWYTKSGKEVAKYFPEAAHKNIPVIFIVEMKG